MTPDRTTPDPAAPDPAASDPAAPNPAEPSAPYQAATDPAAPDPAAPDPAAPDPAAPDPAASDRAATEETTGTRPPGRRRRTVAVVAALVVAVVVVGLLTAPPAAKAPLDPTSDAADGTHALVLLAAALGDRVEVGPTLPAARGGVALVLVDRLSGPDRAALGRWVSAGGTLVVTDPTSPLAGVANDADEADAVRAPQPDLPWPGCDLAPLAGITDLDTAGGVELLAATGSAGGAAGAGETACFRAGRDGALLVARRQGAGVVVVTSPAVWTNAELASADDAALASGLLAPEGATTLTVIGASKAGAGTTGLLGLVSPHVVEGLWGLLGAFLVYVAVRARRLGRPVEDEVAVELPGSGLVLATGHLLQEGGHRGRAGALLRDDLRRELIERIGVPADTPPEALAAIAAERTGIGADRLLPALEGPPPGDDRALLELARLVDRTREVLAGAR